jgi:hypothetical protein
MTLIKRISSVFMVLVIALAIFMVPSLATSAGTVSRSFITMAAPGATINVLLTPSANLPTSGDWFVNETLPAGFTYVNTTASYHSSIGSVQTFTANGGSTFSYTIAVSAAAGTYTFSGTFVDADHGTGTVSGQNIITVQEQINILGTSRAESRRKYRLISGFNNTTISEPSIVNCAHAYLFFTQNDHKRFNRVITIEW